MFFILLMVELHIILGIFLVSILSFFDFIVFNEEILLALCFLSFLFYCFNTLSESVFSSFESRALKFEQDLLLSFNVSKLSLITEFNSYLKLRSFIVQFIILMASLLKFLDQCSIVLAYKPSWVYYQACLLKFNELALFNSNFINAFRKACVVQLLYSLILKKSANDLTLIYSKGISKKFNELKLLSI